MWAVSATSGKGLVRPTATVARTNLYCDVVLQYCLRPAILYDDDRCSTYIYACRTESVWPCVWLAIGLFSARLATTTTPTDARIYHQSDRPAPGCPAMLQVFVDTLYATLGK